MATLVKFVMKRPEGEVTAIFPQLKYNKRIYGNNMLVCYAHLGQHGSACKEWVRECVTAYEYEYKDLLNELISIGYNLKICK